jgi:hypothetical protein
MKRKFKLLSHWMKMLTGKSYYHVSQGLGKAFLPNKLNGYFNDMSAKTNWKGPTDEEGIPINQLLDGSTSYFPTTIVQKALGHHDRYILTRDNKELDEFLNICDWLLKKQDEKGGWEVEKIMNLIGGLRYSAMPQGEAISALVRAWKLTSNKNYIISAIKAYELMITPIEKGGTAYYKNDELYLEEYPSIEMKNTVLNGWIFALFGIYDLYLATGNEVYQGVFSHSFNTLKNNLHIFDSGFWSYYDEYKSLSSPFYHDLHISQLEALFLVTGHINVKHYIEKWKDYRRNIFKRYYAFILKSYQKLKNPSPIVIIN